MDKENEIVYFELNNWFAGEHYPDANGHVYGQFGHEFLEYKEDNIGIKEDND